MCYHSSVGRNFWLVVWGKWTCFKASSEANPVQLSWHLRKKTGPQTQQSTHVDRNVWDQHSYTMKQKVYHRMASTPGQEFLPSLQNLGGRSGACPGKQCLPQLLSGPSSAWSIATKYSVGHILGKPGVRGPHPRANTHLGVMERIEFSNDVTCDPQTA